MKENHALVAAMILMACVMLSGCQTSQTVSRSQPRIPSVWPTVSATEAEIRSYFDSNRGKLDPIEGIYTHRQTQTLNLIHPNTVSAYRMAIVNSRAFRVTNEPSYEFAAVILESEKPEWSSGRVKAHFRKTAYASFYEAKWYMQDYSSQKMDFSILENGVVYSKQEGTVVNDYGYPQRLTDETSLLRIYPLFVPGQQQVTGQVSAQNDQGKGALIGTGSGFILSNSGLVVTNHHVVADGKQIEVFIPSLGVSKKAHVKLKDTRNDIVILEMDGYTSSTSNEVPFSIAEDSKAKIGQEVFTLGFPLGDIMGETARLATGNINSLFGALDDPRLFQINNAIQPGNSGGPLFNKRGELVGICVAGLSARYFYENEGIIPQNMNFAVKASYLKNLIGLLPDGDSIIKRANAVSSTSLEQTIEQISPYVVQIRVY
jgi:S1-C subfamily serine protease